MFHTFLLCPHVEIFAEFLLQFEDFQFFAGVLKMRPLFHAGAQWQEEQVMNCMWIQF
jgi:hypothetical protein